jgi:uncharacterized protein (DUF362 family)
MASIRTASRREFLRTSLLGGAVALAAGRLASASAAESAPGGAPAAAQPAGPAASRVALVAGNDRANLAFKSLEPFKKEIAAAIGDKLVVLKPNNVVINRPLAATAAENLEGILEFLKSIGKTNIILAESTASGPALEGFANYGYDKVAARYGVKMIDLDTGGFETLYCLDEKDMQPHPCRMSKMLLDPNHFVISAAKFKTHDRVVATLSLKNVVVGAAIKEQGTGPGRRGRSDKGITHGGGFRGINYNLSSLAQRLHPHLAVIDGYEGLQGNGPVDGTPVDQRVCVASLDWLAADRVAVELMGIDFGKVGYLNYCARIGNLGQADLARIEIVGPAIEDHIKTYQLPDNIDKQLIWQKPVSQA